MVSIVKDKRPVNLDIGTMRLPITAWASITHRASGVFLFVGTAILMWMLDASLKSPESFAALQECLSGPVAGIKHLIMDFGIGETMEGGVMGARIVFALSVVLILIAGAWIW